MEEKFKYEKEKLKDYIGKNLYEVLKKYNAIIAGGCITSIFTRNDINDVDIYFRNKDDIYAFLLKMEECYIVTETDKAILFKYEGIVIQCIYFDHFENIEDLFKTFDYTVCMGAYDFKTEEFVLHKDFLKHNSQRMLFFNSDTRYPIISALRVDKYKNKGYSISKLEFLKILFAIHKLNINTYDEFINQIGGMYGERFNLVFDKEKLDKENFSLDVAINKLSELSDTYFDLDKEIKLKQESYNGWNDWSLHLCIILKIKLKYFKYNEKYYTILDNEIKRIYKEDIEDTNTKNVFQKCELEDLIKFPIIRYKYVRKLNDGTYHSFYDNSFEYKIGEKAISNGSRGLFSSNAEKIKGGVYKDSENSVMLKVQINSINDVIDIDNLGEVKALTVLEEVKFDKELNEYEI